MMVLCVCWGGGCYAYKYAVYATYAYMIHTRIRVIRETHNNGQQTAEHDANNI